MLAGRALCEVRWQVQLLQFNAEAGRGWSSAVLGASHAGVSRGFAKGPHNDVPHRGGPCWGGLPTSIAFSRPRSPEATTGRGRARDALYGREETGVLVNDRARVVVVMCLMSPLALWKPLRGHLLHQYEPSWNGEMAEAGGGALGQTRPGLQLETARQPCARLQKCHCLRLGLTGRAPKPAQGCQRQTAARGGHRQGRERGLAHSGSYRRVIRERRVSERAGHPKRGLGLIQGLGATAKTPELRGASLRQHPCRRGKQESDCYTSALKRI